MRGKPLQQSHRDSRGSVVMITALMMPVLIGAVGLASDTMYWTLIRRSMQWQADSAALAGAHALSHNQDVIGSVTHVLDKNSNIKLRTVPLIENAPTAGPFAGDSNAVRVRIEAEARMPFTTMFLGRAMIISVEATAGVVDDGEFCLLALDNSDAIGITSAGNATLDASCGMHSNSQGVPAITGQGGADVLATPVSAVGDIDNQNGAFRIGTLFLPYASSQRDPYAHLPNPGITAAANDADVQPSQTQTFTPGTYRGMNIQGNAVLLPGIYYIDGARSGGGNPNNGGLQIGSQATLTGTGVTLILTSSKPADGGSFAGLKISAGATLDLTAPTVGTYQGILIYQDRRAPAMGDSLQINGNSSSRLQGAIYAPRNEIVINGTASMNLNCVQIVGYRLTFTGNSTITNVCPAWSNAHAFKGNVIRLLN